LFLLFERGGSSHWRGCDQCDDSGLVSHEGLRQVSAIEQATCLAVTQLT
jgi:hypothetical protein